MENIIALVPPVPAPKRNQAITATGRLPPGTRQITTKPSTATTPSAT